MQAKSNVGQTKKYDGVKNAVKANTTPEEARITQDEVSNAFRSFGFPINERGHDDIMYWTTKGKSELPNLINDLHKRRMDINNKEDDDRKDEDNRQKLSRKSEDDKKKYEDDLLNEQTKSKATLPRLSDEDINALFDEYGLPSPDSEWARSHLPNDPKKIRSILEMQRKTTDDMLKKHSKNSVNAIPETPKMGAPMPAGGGMGGYYGRGGPAPMPQDPMGMQGGMTQGDEPVTPFFIGDTALIRITNPNNPNSGTLWLVDKKKKVLRPILSERALEEAFEDPEEAKASITTVSAQALGPGGPLEGFTPLESNKGMRDDGSMDDIEFSPAQLQRRYGKQEDPEGENKAVSMLDGLFGNLNK